MEYKAKQHLHRPKYHKKGWQIIHFFVSWQPLGKKIRSKYRTDGHLKIRVISDSNQLRCCYPILVWIQHVFLTVTLKIGSRALYLFALSLCIQAKKSVMKWRYLNTLFQPWIFCWWCDLTTPSFHAIRGVDFLLF